MHSLLSCACTAGAFLECTPAISTHAAVDQQDLPPLLLQESKRNSLKDFVHVAGPLGVTHMLLLTATETACYLRVAKSPRVSQLQSSPGG